MVYNEWTLPLARGRAISPLYVQGLANWRKASSDSTQLPVTPDRAYAPSMPETVATATPATRSGSSGLPRIGRGANCRNT